MLLAFLLWYKHLTNQSDYAWSFPTVAFEVFGYGLTWVQM